VGYSNVVVSPDETLRALKALLEVQESVLHSEYFRRVQSLQNDEAREVLLDIALNSADQANRLADVVALWRLSKNRPQAGPAGTEPDSTVRDILESWVEIKEGSVAIYQAAAAEAPSPELKEALRRLAAEDESYVRALRQLL